MAVEQTIGSESRRPKVLIIHSDVYAFGGAEIVCAHVVYGLQEFTDITVLHCGGPLDSAALARWCGLYIDPKRVRFISAGKLGSLVARHPRLALLKFSLALRFARRIANDYDLVFSTYGECPVTARRKAVYVHVPLFGINAENFAYLGAVTPGLRSTPRVVYTLFCRAIAGWRRDRIKDAITLANSAWTAALIEKQMGIRGARCVYPPVSVDVTPDSSDWIPFEQRENALIMLGRIHPSKRIEMGIEIADQLQSRGNAIELHIVGIARDQNYLRSLTQAITNKRYVFIHTDLSRAQVQERVMRCRYGLHCARYEHFGLAAAEMQMLGCITFVPNEGGQVEVVANPGQRYESVNEAVSKIEKFLCNEALRITACKETSLSVQRFSGKEFRRRVVDNVTELIGAI